MERNIPTDDLYKTFACEEIFFKSCNVNQYSLNTCLITLMSQSWTACYYSLIKF